MKTKRLICIFAALVLILCSAAPAFGWVAAEDSILGKFRSSTGSDISAEDYVIDMAGLLTTEQQNSLAASAAALTSQYQCGVYILTIQDMYDFGYSFIESFSEDWFDTMGYGYGDTGNGVLLVLSMADRDYDICAHGSFGNRAFTDYGKEVMADRFLDHFAEGDYYYGFASYLDTSSKFLERGWNGEYFDIGDSLLSFSERLMNAFVFSLLPAAVCALIAVFVLKGKMNTAKQAVKAAGYIVAGSISITNRYERFTHRTTTRTPRNTNRGGGGHGGTSIGAGGHSHHSGKF